MASLTELAIRYSSDKYYWHSYVPLYEKLFQEIPIKVERVLEIGIGYEALMQPFLPAGVQYVHGSSLKMWSEYWPNAHIFACDIRKDALVNNDQIWSMECDQSKAEDIRKLIEWSGGWFDVVIDDGSHQFEHQLLTAQILLPEVCGGGVYVIEDVWPNNGEELARRLGGELWIGSRGRDDNMVIIKKDR